MSRPEDFKVQDGVLTQYTGTDGEVAIPEGVTREMRALPKLVIHAPAGSQMETAAQDYGNPFVPSEE